MWEEDVVYLIFIHGTPLLQFSDKLQNNVDLITMYLVLMYRVHCSDTNVARHVLFYS